jgi:NAD(P)H-dependent flavin oxidoreductase YrpB (nitropropane dioxygenase family)
MKTRLTELLGIETPIICGGMMRVGTAELAAATSNAGALGVMTALTLPTPELLRQEIEKCQSLTNKPFAVNLTVGVVATEINYDDYVDVICQSGVKIVETAGRSPEPFMEMLNTHGIKVIHKCVAVRHALKAERVGVAAVSIDGFECAGHPGEEDVTCLVLIPAAVQKLTIPVVASGLFDFRNLLRHTIGIDPGRVAEGAEDQRGLRLVHIDNFLLDVVMNGGLLGNHKARAHIDAFSTQSQCSG